MVKTSKKKKKYENVCLYSVPHNDTVPSVYGEDRTRKPDILSVRLGNGPGIVIGSSCDSYPKDLIGIPQGAEGNILVVGSNGSGKSHNIAKPTLNTWSGTCMALDTKGELGLDCLKQYQLGVVKRKPILFDPTQKVGMYYDPLQGTVPYSEDEIGLLWDVVTAIYPQNVNENDKFWRETEMNILMACFIYYHRLGLRFIQIVKKVVSSTVAELCKDIKNSDDDDAKMYMGDLSDSDPRNLTSFSTGLRNSLSALATNPFFERAFDSNGNSSNKFGWNDLERNNIFLCIPEDKIEQWSVPIRIMLNQLFRYLMRRPDKYSSSGANSTQILLLLDEFARFGKIELLTDAISTLRSKKVNICIMIQSLAQLDKIYGIYDRRIICDNCQYKAIMNVNDADTQKYFSELVGTASVSNVSYSNTDDFFETYSSSKHYSYVREPVIYPHEFATLKGIIFLSPYGFYFLNKTEPEEVALLRKDTEKERTVIEGICMSAAKGQLLEKDGVITIQGTARSIKSLDNNGNT